MVGVRMRWGRGGNIRTLSIQPTASIEYVMSAFNMSLFGDGDMREENVQVQTTTIRRERHKTV